MAGDHFFVSKAAHLISLYLSGLNVQNTCELNQMAHPTQQVAWEKEGRQSDHLI